MRSLVLRARYVLCALLACTVLWFAGARVAALAPEQGAAVAAWCTVAASPKLATAKRLTSAPGSCRTRTVHRTSWIALPATVNTGRDLVVIGARYLLYLALLN